MSNFGMLLAPTFRSNVYLQLFLKKGLKPAKIFLLSDENTKVLPGQMPDEAKQMLMGMDIQDYGIDLNASISELIKMNELDCEILTTMNVNDTVVVDAMQSSNLDQVVYSGFGGAIVSKEIINSGVGLLHAHSGKVPEYRGSTTIYYSILKDGKCYVSVFFLDKNIDTGPLLKVKE